MTPTTQQPPNPNPLLTVRQVAARLNVSTTAIYDLINAGSLPCYRIGAGEKRQRIRISETDIAEYLERQRSAVPAMAVVESRYGRNRNRRNRGPRSATTAIGFDELRKYGFKG